MRGVGITFFGGGYIYYLTVSNDEYCALSACWKRLGEPYCGGASLHLLRVMTCNKWSLSSHGQRRASSPLCHVLRYDFNVMTVCGPLPWLYVSHHTRRDVTTVRISNTS